MPNKLKTRKRRSRMSGGAGEAQVSNEVGPVVVVKNDTENMVKFIPDIHDDKAAAETLKKQQDAAAAATAAETLKKQQDAAAAETLKKQQEDAAAAETLKKQQEDATAAETLKKQQDAAAAAETLKKQQEDATAAATAAETLKKQQEDATAIDSTVTDQVDCKGEASLWSPVDPKCIQLKPTPALTALLRAAIANLLANVTSASVEGALEATGNAALIQLATTSAFTPEQLKIMENMSASDNAEMKEAVEKIQSRLSNAVAEGIETARKTVVPPLEKATGEIANGMIVSFLNAVSDIPGVGFVLSALGLIDTAVKAASSAGQIVEEAQEAAKPVTDAIAEVQQTVGKLASEATASEATASVNDQPFAIPQTEEEEQQDNAGLGGGGSRKRRRIHKLSRRIERTLRRVQKKYGFKDKGDFLRRTLKHHKHKR